MRRMSGLAQRSSTVAAVARGLSKLPGTYSKAFGSGHGPVCIRNILACLPGPRITPLEALTNFPRRWHLSDHTIPPSLHQRISSTNRHPVPPLILWAATKDDKNVTISVNDGMGCPQRPVSKPLEASHKSTHLPSHSIKRNSLSFSSCRVHGVARSRGLKLGRLAVKPHAVPA